MRKPEDGARYSVSLVCLHIPVMATVVRARRGMFRLSAVYHGKEARLCGIDATPQPKARCVRRLDYPGLKLLPRKRAAVVAIAPALEACYREKMLTVLFPVSSSPERSRTDPAKAHNPRSEYLFNRFALTRVFFTHTGIMPRGEQTLANALVLVVVMLPLYWAARNGMMVALPVFMLWCLFYLFPVLNMATKRMRLLGWRSELVFLVLAWNFLLVAPPINDEKFFSSYRLSFAALYTAAFWLCPDPAPREGPARDRGEDKG